MTKADLIDSVYEELKCSKREAGDLVERVFELAKARLERGEKFKVAGFGNFVVREKRERVGRNPQTREAIRITARRVLTFKPSQVLKAKINGAGPRA